jgi:hypothetical protein
VHVAEATLHHLDRAHSTGHNPGAQRGQVEAREVGMVLHRDEHRRHAVDGGAALLGDRPQRRPGLEPGPGNDHGGSMQEAAEVGHHHAEAVVERHRNAEPVLLCEPDQLGDEVAVVQDVVVAEGGAFGETRSSGGVLDVDRVRWLQRRRSGGQIGGAGLVGPVEQRRPGGCADVNHVGKSSAFRPDLVEHADVVARLELGRGDHQAGAGLDQRVGQLVGPVCRVDVHQDGAGLRCGDLDDRPLCAVRCPDPHPVPACDSGRDQRSCEPVTVALELAPGPAPSGWHLDESLGSPESGDRAVKGFADRGGQQRGCGVASVVGLHGSRSSISTCRGAVCSVG